MRGDDPETFTKDIFCFAIATLQEGGAKLPRSVKFLNPVTYERKGVSRVVIVGSGFRYEPCSRKRIRLDSFALSRASPLAFLPCHCDACRSDTTDQLSEVNE